MNELTILTRVPSRMSWDQWTNAVKGIGFIRKRLNWVVGDLLLLGEETFGERASQFINELGYTEGALNGFRYICKRFPPDERTSELPWSVYQAIAPFPKREREALIVRALKGELKRDDLRRLAASRNGNGNAAAAPQTELEHLEGNLAQSYVTVGRLMRDGERGQATVNALDELIDAAMAIRAKISDKLSRQVHGQAER